MVRIPIKDLNPVSTVVGTPGVDASAGTIMTAVSGTTDALIKQRDIFQKAEEAKQAIADESAAHGEATNFLVNNVVPLRDGVQAKFADTPRDAAPAYLTEAQKQAEAYAQTLPPKQQAGFLTKTQAIIQTTAGQMAAWGSERTHANAVNGKLSTANKMVETAEGLVDIKDLRLLQQQLPGLADPNIFSDPEKFSGEVNKKMVTGFIENALDKDPQHVLIELEKGTFNADLSAKEVNTLQKRAQTMLDTKMRDQRESGTLALLGTLAGEMNAVESGKSNLQKFERDTLQYQVSGFDSSYIAARNAFSTYMRRGEAGGKELKAEQRDRQTNNFVGMIEKIRAVSNTLKDGETPGPGVVGKYAAIYKEATDMMTSGELSVMSYKTLTGTLLPPITTGVQDARKKSGGWFKSETDKNIQSLTEYAQTQYKPKQKLEKNMLEEKLIIRYLGDYQNFVSTQGREPNKVEGAKLVLNTLQASKAVQTAMSKPDGFKIYGVENGQRVVYERDRKFDNDPMANGYKKVKDLGPAPTK